jgi:hypothetical protein
LAGLASSVFLIFTEPQLLRLMACGGTKSLSAAVKESEDRLLR